jgi:hypothetical protein
MPDTAWLSQLLSVLFLPFPSIPRQRRRCPLKYIVEGSLKVEVKVKVKMKKRTMNSSWKSRSEYRLSQRPLPALGQMVSVIWEETLLPETLSSMAQPFYSMIRRNVHAS